MIEKKPMNAYTAELILKEMQGVEADVIWGLRQLLKKEEYQDGKTQGAICDCVLEASKRFKRAKERYE